MSIHKKVSTGTYWVECDGCGEVYDLSVEDKHSDFPSVAYNLACREVQEAGWLVRGKECTCPECQVEGVPI